MYLLKIFIMVMLILWFKSQNLCSFAFGNIQWKLKRYFPFALEKINNSNVLKTFCVSLFFALYLLSSNTYAQTKDSANNKIPKPTIALKDGATLFSSDNAFNDQISSNKIIRDKADIAYQNNKKGVGNLKMTTPKQERGTITENSELKKEKDLKKEKEKEKSSEKKNKNKMSYIIANNKIHP